MRLISIVTGTPKDEVRISASRKLLNYGFRFFETDLVQKANTDITNVHIWKGAKQKLGLGVAKDIYITTPKGLRNKIKNKIKVEAMIEAPVKKGQSFGQLNIMLGDEQLSTQPLIALSSVEEGGIWRKLVDNIQLMFQ